MNFLDVLQMELENMDLANLLSPQDPISSEDIFVGVLEDVVLKKLYSLALRYEEQIFEILITQERAPEMFEFLLVLNRKAECIKNIFWISLYDKFSVSCSHAFLGIREGWRVVKNSCPQPAVSDGFFIKIPNFNQ